MGINDVTIVIYVLKTNMMKDNALHAYYVHRWRAEDRKIPFLITFDEWYNWWLSNGVDKRLPAPPRTVNTLCMCRYNDTGPYQLGNIYCATSLQNIHSRTFEKLYQPVMTPMGEFKSINDAAIGCSVAVSTIHRRFKSKPTEYYRLNTF